MRLRLGETAVLIGLLAAPLAHGQTRTEWATPSDLLEWIQVEHDRNKRDLVEFRTEASGAFLRIGRASMERSDALLGLEGATGLDPAAFNAVRVRIRARGVNGVVGAWTDRTFNANDSVPFTSAVQVLAKQDEWQDVVLRLSDSPLYANSPVVGFWILPIRIPPEIAAHAQDADPTELLARLEFASTGAAGLTLDPDAYLDLAGIRLVHLDEGIPQPRISRIEPRVWRKGGEATIVGSGFSVPAARNLVLVNDEVNPVLGGDAGHLRVRVASTCERCTLVVRSRGGKAAVRSEPLDVLGSAYRIEWSGDVDRTAPPGSRQRLHAQVLDLLKRPLAGEQVHLSILEGDATLRRSDSVSDARGTIRVEVQLGGGEAPVRVNAEADGTSSMLTLRPLAPIIVPVRPSGLPPVDSLTFTLKHSSPREQASRANLDAMAREYDLVRWSFDNRVLIDDDAEYDAIPVTVGTRRSGDLLLSSYVHQQVYGLLVSHPAIADRTLRRLRAVYTSVPAGPPSASRDEEQTLRHLLAAYFEWQADREFFGMRRARQFMEFWTADHHSWIYATLLKDESRIAAIIRETGLGRPLPR